MSMINLSELFVNTKKRKLVSPRRRNMSMRGRGRGRGRAQTFPSRARNPSAAEVRQRYHKRLTDLGQVMLDSFKNTIASAEIADRATNSKNEFQAQVETAKLSQAAEGILKLNSELKIAMIVQDMGESSQEQRATKKALDEDTRKAKEMLGSLRDNVASTLTALEQHYYRSVPHVRVHEAESATPMQK